MNFVVLLLNICFRLLSIPRINIHDKIRTEAIIFTSSLASQVHYLLSVFLHPLTLSLCCSLFSMLQCTHIYVCLFMYMWLARFHKWGRNTVFFFLRLHALFTVLFTLYLPQQRFRINQTVHQQIVNNGNLCTYTHKYISVVE